MEQQPGRNYVTSNYHHFHKQMLRKRLNYQNNNYQNNNQESKINEENSNNSEYAHNSEYKSNKEYADNLNSNTSFLIHPKGLKTTLSNSDIINHEELLLESPNLFSDENHPDFEKEILENHSFNLNNSSIGNQNQLIPNDNQENNKNQLINLIQS